MKMALCSATPRLAGIFLSIIGVAQGLSLLQLSADRHSTSVSTARLLGNGGPSVIVAAIANASRSGDEVSHMGKVAQSSDDAPSTKEAKDILNLVNNSLDMINEAITTANSSAYAMVDPFLQAISAMQTSLAGLSRAAATAATMGGGEDMATQANKFIDKANATLQKVRTQVPSGYVKASAKLSGIMPELSKLADTVTSKFLEALSAVQDLCNESEVAAQLVKAKLPEADAVHAPGAHGHVAHRHAAHGHVTRGHAAHGHAHRQVDRAKAAALLQERVFQDQEAASVSNVENAMWPKHGQSKEGKARHLIAQANKTLDTLSSKVAEVNATVADALATTLDAVSTALEEINNTVSPALADLPSILSQPVSKALDALMASLQGKMASNLETAVSSVAQLVLQATDALAQVVPLADELQAALDDASESKSSGKAEAGAAESDDTADTGAAETDDSAEADATESNGTAGL